MDVTFATANVCKQVLLMQLRRICGLKEFTDVNRWCPYIDVGCDDYRSNSGNLVSTFAIALASSLGLGSVCIE